MASRYPEGALSGGIDGDRQYRGNDGAQEREDVSSRITPADYRR